MKALIEKFNSAFDRIPHDLIAIIARIGVGTTFFRSGLTKIDGFGLAQSTFYLFENEYKLPLISPQMAAYMGTAVELTMPLLLWSGLLTRFAALALLVMTLVIEIFVYPNAFDTHGVWAVSLLYLLKYGPGRFSIDHFIFSEPGTASPMLTRQGSLI